MTTRSRLVPTDSSPGRRALRLAAAGAGLVFLAAACSQEIGDECSSAADCTQSGDRICDRAQPGGYCTIDGCDESSCPEEAVCVRFFPAAFLTKPCDPRAEDAPGGRDDCRPDELCLDDGLCAPRATERRYCAKSCGGNGDCRGGYECRLAGTRGSMALSRSMEPRRFCAPH